METGLLKASSPLTPAKETRADFRLDVALSPIKTTSISPVGDPLG